MTRRAVLLTAVAVLPALMLTGCTQDYAIDRAAAAARAQQAAERKARAAMPAEYTDANRGVGYRLAGSCAGDETHCRTVDLYAYDTCDAIYLEADLLGAGGKVVGYLQGTTGAVRIRGTARLRLEWSEQAERVRVSDAECRR